MRRNRQRKMLRDDGPDWLGGMLIGVLALALVLLTMH
jgi:hypothetical protein